LSATVEQDQPGWGAGSLPGNESEERLLVAKSHGFDFGEGADAFDIQIGGGSEEIAAATLSDIGKGEIQAGISPLHEGDG
jgi:hypothetical protein